MLTIATSIILGGAASGTGASGIAASAVAGSAVAGSVTPALHATVESVTTSPGAGIRPTYRWPLQPAPPDPATAVSRAFERPPAPWAAGHRGVDIPAQPGDLVLASGTGVVAFAGVVVDRPVVSIEHASGLRTTYEPVSPTVRVGEPVTAGDPIGTVATGGHCADCLHWGARAGRGYYLDPLLLLTGDPTIRLYPPVAW